MKVLLLNQAVSQIQDKNPLPVIPEGNPAPPELFDVINGSVQLPEQEVFYGGMWVPYEAHIMHLILQLLRWTRLLKPIHCNHRSCSISRGGY